MNYELTVSSSPHVHADHTTRTLMARVLLALAPAVVYSIWLYGFRALAVYAVSIAACVFFEWGYRRMMKKDCTVGDLSAVVTGLLMAMVCPPTVPYWMLIFGALFAIVVVKQLYGGIGKNFLNPALAARAFMMISWAALMTAWAKPQTWLDITSNYTAPGVLDGITAATPLAAMKDGNLPLVGIWDAFVGNVGGCLGESSALLLAVGGIYLMVRKVISFRIPVSFIATVALLAFLFPQGNDRFVWMGYQVFTGGVFLGAIFMATDYVTSPVSAWGQVVFGIGCGALTILIRYFGGYPEGVSFAILIMNVLVGFLDRLGVPARYGAGRKGGKTA